jgi:hypothetical protein
VGKISNKDFVRSRYPNAVAFQGIGARYTILKESPNLSVNDHVDLYLMSLSNVCATENAAWKDAAHNIKTKEEK